jgi:hypothetical protein
MVRADLQAGEYRRRILRDPNPVWSVLQVLMISIQYIELPLAVVGAVALLFLIAQGIDSL